MVETVRTTDEFNPLLIPKEDREEEIDFKEYGKSILEGLDIKTMTKGMNNIQYFWSDKLRITRFDCFHNNNAKINLRP